ncbi:unnamed protein product [Clonostachys rhizophaga]|uniref:Extradiol ring-cleavage dioxygenase class III enzyme subunit B domain-containing protein n=2 Tax=Clonostachys TaxID=110564 RepID=A0A9N9YHK8_9HYPO|nr:unnamed protein product [Clonostachys rhizophaga]
MALAPVIALSHGGGPLPILGDPDHKTIIDSLEKRIPKLLSLDSPANRPRAIVLVTAHWQTKSPAISSGAQPDLIYDYYGFPPESYELKYPAKGDPAIAAEIADLLKAEGFNNTRLDPRRGFDHGVFVPMTLARPQADVPIVQMSVLETEDPESHLRIGRALQKLREKNIAIVGSGFASFHNIRIMMAMRHANPVQKAEVRGISEAWNGALAEALKGTESEKRWGGIQQWKSFPGSQVMHPPGASEHLTPLIVCAGAAADGEVTKSYKDEYLGVDILTFYWGSDKLDEGKDEL